MMKIYIALIILITSACKVPQQSSHTSDSTNVTTTLEDSLIKFEGSSVGLLIPKQKPKAQPTTSRDTLDQRDCPYFIIGGSNNVQLPDTTITNGRATLKITPKKNGAQINCDCAGENRLIKALRQTIEKVKKTTITITKEITIYRTPWWMYMLIGLLIAIIIYLLIRKIL